MSDLEVLVEGDPIEIAFNARYLIDVLSVIDEPEVVLETTSPTRPGMLKPKGNDYFLCASSCQCTSIPDGDWTPGDHIPHTRKIHFVRVCFSFWKAAARCHSRARGCVKTRRFPKAWLLSRI